MRLLETTEKFATNSEVEAKDLIEKFRTDAAAKGYCIKKAGYEYKTKKSKGEIIAEVWPVTIIMTHGGLWEDN